MNRTLQSVLIVACAVMSVAGFAGVSGAETYASKLFGYHMETPEGWERIPDEIVQAFRKAMFADNRASANIIYDAGFQQGGSDEWMAYPYVIVQPITYASLGQSRQPTERQISQIVRGMAGLDVNAELNKMATEQMKDVVGRIDPSQPVLDLANRRFSWVVDGEVEGVGKVRTFLSGYFGHEAVVQVGFACPMEMVDETAAERAAIFGSFRFDQAHAYQESQAGKGVDTEYLKGLGSLAAVVIIVYYLFGRIRKGGAARQA